MKKIQIKLGIMLILAGIMVSACNDTIDYSFHAKEGGVSETFAPLDTLVEFGRDSASLAVASGLIPYLGTSSATWCRVENQGYETRIVVDANTTGNGRDTKVTLKGNGASYDITVSQAAFVHPGILHSPQGIERVRDLYERQPWPGGSSYYVMVDDGYASDQYKIKGPYEAIHHTQNRTSYASDFKAAYENAWMWILTGKETHARKALEIMRAYGAKKVNINSATFEPMWLGGYAGSTWANTAELLRYTYPAIRYQGGWNEEDTRMAECFSRIISDFIIAFLDNEDLNYNGNKWGIYATSGLKGLMASGVFMNDMTAYNRGVNEYKNGTTVGALNNFILPGGQNLLADVTAQHQYAQWELNALAEACEIAWNQGTDLYAELGNRLMQGFEYEAAYLLGQEVNCQVWPKVYPTLTQTGVVSQENKTQKAVWELPYNHYTKIKGQAMPNTLQMLKQVRPEGQETDLSVLHAIPGFGTLLFYID